MAPSIDAAILEALSLDATTAKISAHGGSGFASIYRIITPVTSIFVKISTSRGAATMFEGEHTSLNAINRAVPTLCPRSFAWGKLDDGGYFLATEFLDMNGNSMSRTRATQVKGSGMSLAQKLATLHSIPVPNHSEGKGFGFPVTTCCGDTQQDNSFKQSWAEFFGQNRLMHILEQGEKNNGKDTSLRKIVEEIVEKVVPRLLADGHLGGSVGIIPVVTHGDLWSGNKGRASFVGRGGLDVNESSPMEEVIFDPSAAYAHSEYDHGIMNMFGGFSNSFWKEYHSILPKTEPIEEYEDRVSLYESYHHLNHYAIFGGSYKSSAINILKSLLKKYDED